MRTSSLLLLTALAACSDEPGELPVVTADQGRVACALSRAAGFAPVCALERVTGKDGLELTIRHPDGGFRRFVVTRDGRGVIAADGAEPARVSVANEREIEVAVGPDRYRLPATVKGRPLTP